VRAAATLGGIALLALAAQAWAQQAQLRTYVDQPGGADTLALGYPVPMPIASLTPVDGFREYASLMARLQALALASPDLSAHRVGSSMAGRDIWAFRVSSPGDLDREGRPKPAFLFNVTTHAREWQAPEVGAGLIEYMVEQADDPLVRYLLDNTVLIILPVQNVDGFLQTQRYPDQALLGADPSFPQFWPRDGRLRRKNMRGVDEDLFTVGDHLLGIDLNRNHPPRWNTDPENSSSDPRSLLHHGAAPHSEAESQALVAAIQALMPPDGEVRLGVDVHSYSQVFFSVRPAGHPRLHGIQQRLLQRVASHHRQITVSPQFPQGILYRDAPSAPGVGFGTASQYFSETFLVPAWTLEIEPDGEQRGRMYGGFGVTHDGFIMPASRIRAVREAWAASHLVALYAMADPPHLRALRVLDRDSGELRVERRWRRSGNARALHLARDLPLLSGRSYRLDLVFDKPMRYDVAGAASQLPGQLVPFFPTLRLLDGDSDLGLSLSLRRWQGQAAFFERYGHDTFSAEFVAPAALAGRSARIEVQAQDMLGEHLDARPDTPVAFVGGAWSGYEDSFGMAGDQGGSDTSHALSGAAQEPAEPILRTANRRLLEGGVLNLRFERRRADGRAVAVTVADVPGLSADPSTLAWGVQETGTRTLRLRLADNDTLGDAGEIALALGGDSAEPAAQPLLVRLDNDDASRRRVVVASADAAVLDAALAAAAAGGYALDLLIEAGVDFDLAAAPGATALPVIAGDVRLRGENNRLRLAGDGRFFEVAAGARLELQGLQLVGGRADDGGQILNRGELVLSRVRLEGGHAARGAAIFNEGGTVHMARSLVRLAQGEGALAGSGSFEIESSTFSANEGAQAGAFDVSGSLNLRSVSLVGNRARHPLLQLGSGSASFDHVLIAGNQVLAGGAPCNLPPVTVEHSLADAAGCGLGAAQVSPGPLVAAFDPHLGGHLPLAAAQQRGAARCGGDDQSGAARPFGAACDAGALEAALLPFRGLWIPDRPGHGIDLHLIGNVLFALWYTYAEDGTPVAYTAQGVLDGPDWQAPLYAHHRRDDGGSGIEEVGSLGIDFSHDGALSSDRARLSWRFHDGDAGEEGLQAFIYAEGAPRLQATGAWADPAELGYGFTIGTRGDTLVTVLYYYDGEGRLRWMLGDAPYDSAARVPMFSYTGFCPNCDAQSQPPTPQAAGEVLLDFLAPDRARAAIRVSYPGGGDWVRNTSIVPLNPPVDNTLTRVP
jgi:hypothetical protein